MNNLLQSVRSLDSLINDVGEDQISDEQWQKMTNRLLQVQNETDPSSVATAFNDIVREVEEDQNRLTSTET